MNLSNIGALLSEETKNTEKCYNILIVCTFVSTVPPSENIKQEDFLNQLAGKGSYGSYVSPADWRKRPESVRRTEAEDQPG